MMTMTRDWKAFLLRALVLGLVIFVAVRTAVARPGLPGGAARSFITIAGTVTGVPAGMTTMRFTFRHRGPGDGSVAETSCVRDVPTPIEASGEFAAEVPLEPFTPECPEAMFDGRDVSVDVSIGGVMVVERSAVNQVPYAIHADTAATAAAAAPDGGLERQLATAAASVPPGTIVAFGGERVPDGWLLCDGREIARSMYPALFTAIGTAWGAGTSGTTFALPDLRGRFLRGVDGDAGVDPDRDTRLPSSDGGVSGNRVGTQQRDAVGQHTHRFLINYNGPGGGGPRGYAYVGGGSGSTEPTIPEGARETRPVNAAVHYLIRY